MLSGESAMGKFPEEAVAMLAKIAAFTEAHRPPKSFSVQYDFAQLKASTRAPDRMASLVEHALHTVPCDLVLVPTRGGMVARAISRFKPPVWIIAPSSDCAACQNLGFSYGVYSINLAEEPEDWREWIAQWVRKNAIAAKRVLLVAGPSPRNPKANYRVELMRLDAQEMPTAEKNA
jgi:pyruvate kinase